MDRRNSARNLKRPEESGDVGQALCRRVRELRKKKHWTLEELSAAGGVSRPMRSEIERGNANRTLAVTCRIAQAFEMSMGELVEMPLASPRVDVIRADAIHSRRRQRHLHQLAQ